MQERGKAAFHAALHTAGAFLRLCSLKSVAVVALLILFVSTANAQLSGKGSIQGTVVDPTGAVIPGANVTVVNTATNVKQISTTTSSGDYNINVEPGAYTVTVSMSGFKSFTQENVKVNAMEVAGVNITLQTGDASETITVTDAPPAIETSNATLGATMEQEMYAALPVMQDGNQRRATDFAGLMPGVQANVTNGNQNTNTGNINGSSSRGAVSSVYINGVPITSVQGQGDPRFIWTAMPLEAINQFQVQTVGYSAIYEGQGVQNYIVKSGTNKFHGGVFDYFRNTALDTWGYMAPAAVNPKTGKPEKPIEHQNEYGIYLGGPILKDKLFYFGVYEGYRYAKGPYYAYQTNPTSAMMAGNFAGLANIYNPKTSTCSGSGSSINCSRTQFDGNAIPDSQISTVAKKMQSLLPSLTNQNPVNNYLGGYSSGLSNWSTTHRLDWSVTPSHSMSLVVAAGRQATTGAAGQTSVSSTSNQAPAPFVTSQAYAPKTMVVLYEDTYTVNPHIVNQFKFGFGRYDAPGFSQSIGSAWSAKTMGFTGIPVGQAWDAFPKVTFSGTWVGNQWAGYTDNKNVANSYTLVDSVQWLKGKHSITFGGQIAWMQYNYTPASTGTTPLQLSFSSSETAAFAAKGALSTTTGHPYASFLLGAVNSGTFTQNAAAETGARFRPISPYVQDDWKVSSKLTLNLGLRWDYYPSYREAQDRMSWMDPTKTNSLVGIPGALVFAGKGAGRCNCRTNVDDYYKNFGPRIGFAYQSDSKTVWRGSWGVIYSHGNNVGGSAQSRQGSGIVGFSASPKTIVVNQPTGNAVGSSYWQMDSAFPTYQAPPFISSNYGTYNTTISSSDVISQSVSYADPYYGGRAPQFINWSFGIQRQLTNDMTLTASYVGSQSHFLYVDSNNGRGYWSNQLDPKWLSLREQLTNPGTDTNLAAAGVNKPYASYNGSTGSIAQALKPFPQYNGVSDAFGQVGNSNYHALQVSLLQRARKNLTFMVNYTWSKSIDNSGTFRSGYDIPAAYATDNKFHAARSLDRSLSAGHQPHRIVITGAYALPFGKGHLGDSNVITRYLLSDWKFSEIFQANSGSPMAVIMGSCNVNPAQVSNGCVPMINPSFSGKVKTKDYGSGATAATIGSTRYLNADAFMAPPNFMFSTTARTAPLNIYNSGNYNLDLSLRRAFSLKFEGAKLIFQADMFNATNHTRFGFGSQTIKWLPSTNSNSDFGTVTVLNSPRTVQLAARIEF